VVSFRITFCCLKHQAKAFSAVGYELFIAFRYLRSKRRTGFISLITYISAAGVMIGVAALVIVLSAANGFESEVRDRIIGADAHLKVTMFHGAPLGNYSDVIARTRALPHITGASPFISGKGMIRMGTNVEGVLIKGIDHPPLAM
jgi:lipoprotein-releasing system permease protein